MLHPGLAELQELVTQTAFEPLGSSIAAAIVTCIIYGLFFFLALHSFLATKYIWYDVILVSTAFRAAAQGSRAAYLSHYAPGLQGTFLALFNAGFSASGAAVWLTLATWFKNKGVRIFSERGEKAARLFCYLMCIPILAFGPIMGVLAAGLIYGAWQTAPHAAYMGDRCRRASTYGILVVFAILFSWVTLLNIRINCLMKSQRRALTSQKNEAPVPATNKNPQLIWWFSITVALELLRGCTGVVALYKNKEFVWANDKYFYPLNVLPDYLILCILCWPRLLARISCTYPSQSENQRDEEDAAYGHAKDQHAVGASSP